MTRIHSVECAICPIATVSTVVKILILKALKAFHTDLTTCSRPKCLVKQQVFNLGLKSQDMCVFILYAICVVFILSVLIF